LFVTVAIEIEIGVINIPSDIEAYTSNDIDLNRNSVATGRVLN
jgi:hypothetical protein